MAEIHNLEIEGDPLEESMTATKPGRPVFSEMIELIMKGTVKIIVCWKLDRLSRNPIDEGTIKWLLQQGIIEMIVTNDRVYYPEDNAFIASVEFVMANQFSRDLSKNTKRGLDMKLSLGQPPYYANTGYINDPITKDWKPDPERSHFVTLIFEWYATGQYSQQQIVDKLNQAGFTTRHGKKLQKSTLGSMLRNPCYYGWFLYRGELQEGTYEPLTDKETWLIVQDRLDGRVSHKKEKTKLSFKYRNGVMVCGECECDITAEIKHQCICTECKTKYSIRTKTKCPKCKTDMSEMDNPSTVYIIYYRCTKSKGKCSQKYVREEILEPQVLSIFEDLELKEEDIKSIQKELIKLYEKDQIFQRETIKNLKTELTRLEDQKRKLFQRMLLGDLDKDAHEMAKELKNEITNKISSIQSKISSSADSSYSWLEQSSNLLNLVNEAGELFKQANSEQKHQLLNFVSSNLVLKDKKLSYTYKEPFALAVEMKTQNAERPENDSDRPNWLPRQVPDFLVLKKL